MTDNLETALKLLLPPALQGQALARLLVKNGTIEKKDLIQELQTILSGSSQKTLEEAVKVATASIENW